MEPVYDTVITAARLLWLAEGLKFKVSGGSSTSRPRGGRASSRSTTPAISTSPTPVSPAHLQGRRKVRFMAKKEVFDNKISGPIMRSLKHIPVDRAAGADSYRAAVDYLKRGELVGVYPEATISRSFEIKAFKSGAARMAIESGAPIIPTVIWGGAQRVWTKGHPKKLGRTGYPISIGGVCEALEPTGGDPDALTAKLHEVMSAKLIELQDAYGEHPQGRVLGARETRRIGADARGGQPHGRRGAGRARCQAR